jgi:hypothetical protein
MEQFPVNVLSSPTSRLIKCKLQRHRSCTHLKQYQGVVIEVEPHSLIQEVEKFLLVHDYARLRDDDFNSENKDLVEARNEVTKY